MRDRSILPLILAAFLIAWGQGWIDIGGGGILPDDRPLEIYPPQPSVLFAVDESITDDQRRVGSSMVVREFAEQNGIDWRRYDVDQDMTKEETHWRQMMEATDGDPKMVTANKEGGRADEIPTSIEAAMDELREVVK